jgi:transcriptional regulator with XRE-family HTH domain
MTLGKRIVHLRKQKNLNQKQLADRLGIASRQLVRWENDRARPRPKALEQLAEVLEIPIQQLVAEAAHPTVDDIDDPELRELLNQIQELSQHKLDALKTVMRDMIACEQITRVTTRTQRLAS